MSEEKNFPCPFVYSNGRQCCGHIYRVRLYGHRPGDPLILAKKVRLWCSEKDDHSGSVSSFDGKERMEFYPDQLGTEIFDAIENGDIPNT